MPLSFSSLIFSSFHRLHAVVCMCFMVISPGTRIEEGFGVSDGGVEEIDDTHLW